MDTTVGFRYLIGPWPILARCPTLLVVVMRSERLAYASCWKRGSDISELGCFRYLTFSYQEAENRMIELKDDDSEAVRLMLQYFYSFDYETTDANIAHFGGELCLHAVMYSIADKYQAPDLKVTAAKKFSSCIPPAMSRKEDAVEVTKLVYTSTPSGDRTLRDMILHLWFLLGSDIIARHGQSQTHEMLRTVPDFTTELAMKSILSTGNTIVECQCECNETYSCWNRRDVFTVRCSKCKRTVTAHTALSMRPRLILTHFCRDCQVQHWNEHKIACKDERLKAEWRPSWFRESRPPAFMLPRRPAQHGGKKYLWGNVPALDVVQLERNEGGKYKKDLNLLFAGGLSSVL
ncbi:hypothetical protein MRB53_038332 [Persea americana]|nr:hypothetical protein MRB53_038332 [Persea americana]